MSTDWETELITSVLDLTNAFVIKHLGQRLKPGEWKLSQQHVAVRVWNVHIFLAMYFFVLKLFQQIFPTLIKFTVIGVIRFFLQDKIVFRIHQHKTGLCVFVSVPLPTGVPQSHLCSREFIYTSLMQHFEAGKSTTQQSATVCHPLTHDGQHRTEFNREQYTNNCLCLIWYF